MSIPPEDSIKFLRGLRAIRQYTSEPVAEDALNDILDIGRWSGSASNRQPTEVIVVRDPAVRQQLAEGGAAPAATAVVALVIATDANSPRHDLDLFDQGRLVERLLLAARAHGLGSNVATLKGEGPETIKKLLGVPDERDIHFVVTIGHTDVEARKAARPATPGQARKPREHFAHWDRY